VPGGLGRQEKNKVVAFTKGVELLGGGRKVGKGGHTSLAGLVARLGGCAVGGRGEKGGLKPWGYAIVLGGEADSSRLGGNDLVKTGGLEKGKEHIKWSVSGKMGWKHKNRPSFLLSTGADR